MSSIRKSRLPPALSFQPGHTMGAFLVQRSAAPKEITFASLCRNGSSHPHSLHFHGFHTAEMDGVPGTPGMVQPGESFTYEFDAEPFGLHLYHCHVAPLARHIAKGSIWSVHHRSERRQASGGSRICDGDERLRHRFRQPERFLCGQCHPIPLPDPSDPDQVGEKVRIYLVNILEYDLINSFHLHANFFNYYPTGTSLTPANLPITSCRPRRSAASWNSLTSTPVCICSTPTIRSLLSWAGPATSKSSRKEMNDDRKQFTFRRREALQSHKSHSVESYRW